MTRSDARAVREVMIMLERPTRCGRCRGGHDRDSHPRNFATWSRPAAHRVAPRRMRACAICRLRTSASPSSITIARCGAESRRWCSVRARAPRSDRRDRRARDCSRTEPDCHAAGRRQGARRSNAELKALDIPCGGAKSALYPTSRSARGHGAVMVVSAGTSDMPVAEEAAICAELFGNRVARALRRRRRRPASADR